MKRYLLILPLFFAVSCGGDDQPVKRGDFVNGDGFISGHSSVVAGPGIQVQSGTVSINPTYTQRRVSGSCTAPQSVASVNQDGTVSCASGGGTGTVTSVSVGTGLGVTNPSTTPNITLSLAGATCSAGQGLTALSSTGTGTCSADVTAVAAGTGISAATVSGTATVTANLAGGTCTNGQVATALSSTGTLTCANTPAVPTNQSYQYAEFLNGATGDPWLTNTGAGTGVACSAVSTAVSTGGHPGVLDCTMGTTTTGHEAEVTNVGVVEFDSSNGLVYQSSFQIPTLSTGTDTYAIDMGFINNNTAAKAQTAGLYFEYDQATTTTNVLRCVATANSVTTIYSMDGTTTDDTSATTCNSTMTAGTWYTVQIVDNAANNSVSYWFGTSTSNLVKCCTITTHIPTGTGATEKAGVGFVMLKSAGTSSRDLYTDYILMITGGSGR